MRYEVEVTEPTEYIDRSFPTASWWRKYEIQPGTYEVVPWSNLPYYNHFKADAVIIEDYFASNFAGANYQPYDRKQNAGKQDKVWLNFPAAYELAHAEFLGKWLANHPTYIVYSYEEV